MRGNKTKQRKRQARKARAAALGATGSGIEAVKRHLNPDYDSTLDRSQLNQSLGEGTSRAFTPSSVEEDEE